MYKFKTAKSAIKFMINEIRRNNFGLIMLKNYKIIQVENNYCITTRPVDEKNRIDGLTFYMQHMKE